jgi:putative membrane protein
VRIDGGGELLLAAAVLAVVTAFVKPVLLVLSIPLIVLTLGLFLLVVNVAVLAITDWLVDGFDIEGWWTYVGTVVVVWLVNVVIGSFLGGD